MLLGELYGSSQAVSVCWIYIYIYIYVLCCVILGCGVWQCFLKKKTHLTGQALGKKLLVSVSIARLKFFERMSSYLPKVEYCPMPALPALPACSTCSTCLPACLLSAACCPMVKKKCRASESVTVWAVVSIHPSIHLRKWAWWAANKSGWLVGWLVRSLQPLILVFSFNAGGNCIIIYYYLLCPNGQTDDTDTAEWWMVFFASYGGSVSYRIVSYLPLLSI